MAATIPAKTAVPTSKIKRPAPPALQTSINGNVSQSSPSPSIGNKRPPPGFSHPSNATTSSNGVIVAPNGVNSRLGNRRKEPQKPLEGTKARKGGISDGAQGDRRTPRKVVEPYSRWILDAFTAYGSANHFEAKTTSYMLRKYRKHPPSFTLHLHPTHFRFDDQDGSFSYNSPMKVLLEHIRSQTVPHIMLDDLQTAHIKFYEST